MNEKDCINVVLKGWQALKVGREIHDILWVQGFIGLPNGMDNSLLVQTSMGAVKL
ncbi:MAG TPA: hypothetical protein VJP79_01430 [Nitrososphaera sp.]|nr:hypothetical protein [Nitrososphaera sp.]